MKNMLPDWMNVNEEYAPPKDGGAFIIKTINAVGTVLARIKVQSGHEKKHALPAIVKLIAMLVLVIIVSVSHNRLILFGVFAAVQLYLAMWPARDILSIYRTACFAAFLALIIFLPAIIINPDGRMNNLMVVLKVFVSVETVSIFNHTTQWNHVTEALRKLYLPGIFVFTLDITLKYIVLLGNLIKDILVALSKRSVGRNNKKYQSIGGVMGVTFLRSTQMSQQMYEAMRCRGFTDDYRGL